MDKVIYSGNGIEIVEDKGKVFVVYDAGEIVVDMRRSEITEAEAKKAMISERDAYEVILETQSRS